MKKAFLILLCFLPFGVSAYNTDDIIQRFFSVSPSGTNEYLIPEGKDLIIQQANVMNYENQPQEVVVYDSGSLVFQASFSPGANVGEYNMHFTESLKVSNTNTGSDLNIYYRGFLIDEGTSFTENGFTETDSDKRFIDYLLLVVFVIIIWKIILATSYYFRK